jgi:hypothetical protein
MEKREDKIKYEQEREDEYTALSLQKRQKRYSARTHDLI